MPASQAEILNNAIAGTLHRRGGPLDKLAQEWVVWWEQDRPGLEAGGVLTAPWFYGALRGWWRRYRDAFRKEFGETAAPPNVSPPDTVEPRVAAIANDQMRRVVEANAAVANQAERAAAGVVGGFAALLPLIVLALGLYYLIRKQD